jgi:hypothetical protein
MARPATPESIEESKKLARQFSQLCNTSSLDIPTFVAQVTQYEHRTLQQREMVVLWECIVAWAENDKPGHYDARNEATVKLCRWIVDTVGKEQYFPYV